MATSDTFTSGRYGHSSYGPWLTLSWSQVSQSVANNTTTLDLTLRFHWDQDINYTVYNKKGSVQGNSYTYSGSFSGASGSKVLKTQRVTITHNSNGSKSVSLSANITSLGIYWYSGGTTIGTMSVSGTANLETIPRATTMSAFSFNTKLKNGTANQINYTIDRKSDAFRHHIELRDGNTVVRTWDNQSSDGKSTLPLTATEVNTLLNRMSSSTTRSYTLRVATRSGHKGGWIGSAVSRNATATVHDDVKPSVGAVTLSQTGNPVSTHTLQGFSKIKASFTRSAGYGATISSSSIQVRRRSYGIDSQTINSNDGTTTNAVSLHGVYEARGTTRDSRGRTTNTAWATITVTQYSAPSITNFSAVRNGSTATTVNLSRATTHTVLGTSNHLTYTIQRRQGTGAWTNVNSGATGTVTTSGATGSATSTGNSVTQSYEFRLVVTDKLGGRAESLRIVSTQRVVLDIHKNEGVGIGKIHEQGVLDVDGQAYFRGDVFVNNASISSTTLLTDMAPTLVDTNTFWMNLPQGSYFVSKGQLPNQPTAWGIIQHNSRDGEFNTIWYAQPDGQVYRKSGNRTNNTEWKLIDRPEEGSNTNGRWIKFNGGALVCWLRGAELKQTKGGWRLDGSWTFPQQFTSYPTVNATIHDVAHPHVERGIMTIPSVNSTSVQLAVRIADGAVPYGTIQPCSVIAIGRWR